MNDNQNPITNTPNTNPPAVQPPEMPSIPPAAPSQVQTIPNPPKKHRKGGSFLIMLLLLLFIAAAGAATYFFTTNASLNEDVEALETKISSLDADIHELPEGSIKVSECVPNMGFHYLAKQGDPRLGPFYLVNKQGEVIGIELMFNESMMSAIDVPEFPVEVLTSGPVDLNDWQFKNIEMSRSPEGHEGFEDDHMDLHLYTVSPEIQARSCQ